MGIGFKSTTLRWCHETKTFIIRERARLFVSPASARIALARRPSAKINWDPANITAMGIFLSSRRALAFGHQKSRHWSYHYSILWTTNIFLQVKNYCTIRRLVTILLLHMATHIFIFTKQNIYKTERNKENYIFKKIDCCIKKAICCLNYFKVSYSLRNLIQTTLKCVIISISQADI